MKYSLTKTLDKLSHDTSLSELKFLYSNNKSNDLSYHDTLYLNLIDAHPNKYTSSYIADLLKISRPAVTQKINELAKKGYIIRTQSETDKRIYYLSINPESSYCDNSIKVFDTEVENKAIETYGEDKVDLLCEMLEFICDMYSEQIAMK